MQPIFPANPEERVGFYGGRIAEGLWGEPLNLAANVCLVLYMLYYLFKLKRDGFSDAAVYLLVLLGGLVGFGSVIFHSHPNRVTLQMDLIPVTAFGLAYIFYTARRYFNQTYIRSALFTMLFILISTAFKSALGSFTVPGMHHLPSIAALLLIGAVLIRYRNNAPIGRKFLIAAMFYFAALFFRIFDLVVFRWFPLGTHFVWHAGTAVVIILLIRTAALQHGTKGKST